MSAAIRTALIRLRAPEEGTVWNGPFEQLVGAGYSLLTADAHGIGRRSRRNYHNQIRKPLIGRLIRYIDSQVADVIVENALAGFYFNAAKQRLVWSGERLLRALAYVPCPRGDFPRQYTKRRSKRGDILRSAKACVVHAHELHDPGLPRTCALLESHEAGLLATLHEDVNARKHSLYPDDVIAVLARRPEVEQVHVARDAFTLLIDSYLELLAWAPSARRDQASLDE